MELEINKGYKCEACPHPIDTRAIYVNAMGRKFHWICWIYLIDRHDLPENPKLEVRYRVKGA